MRQLVRLTKMAKLSRLDRDIAASIVKEEWNKVKGNDWCWDSKKGIDVAIEWVTRLLQRATEAACPPEKARKGVKYKPCPWWTPELHSLRREANTVRNRLGRKPSDKLKQEHARLRRKLQNLIRKEKRNLRRRWAMEAKQPWKLLNSMKKKSAMTSVLGDAESGQESADLLFDTFFPKSEVTGEAQQSLVDELKSELDEMELTEPTRFSFEDFSVKEVKDALLSLGMYKSPGPDGIPGITIHASIDILLPFWVMLFNACGRLGYFPDVWKKDVTIVIPKPGKDDYSVPKAYRPISLLSQLGKTLERLYVNRVNRLHEEVGVFSKEQHGFMLNRSCMTALDDLLQHIRDEQEQDKKVLMMNLDVEGAFNRTWHVAILKSMLKKGIPSYIVQMVRSFLADRVVRLLYAGSKKEDYTPDGCPQGAVFSPMFYKFVQELIIEAFQTFKRDHQLGEGRVKKVKTDQDFIRNCQADKAEWFMNNFADDSTVVLSGYDRDMLCREGSRFLEWLMEYCKDIHVSFAPKKTKCLMFWKKEEADSMVNMKINVQCSWMPKAVELKTLHEELVRLLGVYFDPFLNWDDHIDIAIKKCMVGINMMRALAGSGWGMKGKHLKIIFKGLVEAVLFYGLEVIAHAALKKHNLRKFNKVFALGAKAICRASSSASWEGAMAMAGIAPPRLRIKELLVNRYLTTEWFHDKLADGAVNAHLSTVRVVIRELKLERMVGKVQGMFKFLLKDNPAEVVLKGESYVVSEPRLQIYTDGSSNKHGVGCGLVVYNCTGSQRLYEWKLKLNNECDIFQAEMRALREAIEVARNLGMPVDIFVDSLSVLTSMRFARKGTAQLFDLITNWPPWARAIWVKAHVGVLGNEDADAVAVGATLSSWVNRETLRFSVGTVKKATREWVRKQWEIEWRRLTCNTSMLKTFFPELKDFEPIWRKGFWSWETTSMVLGRLPLNDSYVGSLNDEIETESCDCFSSYGAREDLEHYLFECPKYDHLRLGWNIYRSWSLERKCRWAANNLTEMKSFIVKSKRFVDKKTEQGSKQSTGSN